MADFILRTTGNLPVTEGTVFSVVPEKIQTFMKADVFLPEDVEAYCDWSGENYYPVELEAESEKYPEGTLVLMDGKGGCRNFTMKEGKTVISNLESGIAYTVTLLETDYSIGFSTEAGAPRMLRVPGTDNTRDLGGKLSEDGSLRMKQGLVYRGANLRGVGEDGLEVLVRDLGIRTELDLSGGYEAGEEAKKLLNLEAHSIRWYQWIFEKEPEYTEQLLECLRLFEKEENYPFYIHCSLGRDRTGTLAYILQAICGISVKDLYREHLLTFFSLRGDGEHAGVAAHLGNINALTDGFFACKGREFSIRDNVLAFLTSIGFEEWEADKIREILTEKA